jgi:16S rRNA (guanine966-N2)-methyltransferase
MRIVSGTKRGKKLFTPQDDSIRPTADKVRSAIYNILYTKLENPLTEYTVLDIFSGSGALGLEALSRGAKSTTFVDINLTLTKKNISACGFNNVELIQKDARFLGLTRQKYNLVFMDAPYNKGLTEPTLKTLITNNWLEKNTILVVETAREEILDLSEINLEVIDERTYGSAKVTFFEYK